MKQFKYTKNNEKLLVEQKLDSNNYVVKYVYLEKGTNKEIISEKISTYTGELFDVPVEKYEDVRLRQIKEEINTLDKKLTEYKHKVRVEQAVFSDYLKTISNLKTQINPVISHIEKFFTGKYTHIVQNVYDEPRIYEFYEFLIKYADKDRYSINGIPVISFFKNSDNSIVTNISAYKDGSGSSHPIILCESYEDAIKEASNIINNSKNGYYKQTVKAINTYNLPFNEEKMKNYKDTLVKQINNELLSKKSQLELLKKEIEKLNKESKELVKTL